MTRFIRTANVDAPHGIGPPHVLPPVDGRRCLSCPRGPTCAGGCGRRVCKFHGYHCTREACPQGILCSACFDRHEVCGQHAHPP